jgi:GNAT superfamily N-acetyltransferase
MLFDPKLSPVLIRPALPKDKPEVLELAKHIWDGGDYIPYVWDEWLAEQDGIFVVSECDGKVAGLAKLTRFAPGDWFMEGLRVHPDWREKGIASRLNDYQLEYWRKHGEGSVRLATASYNVKVHHMAERNGFERIMEFVPFTAPQLADKRDEFEPVTPAELPEVIEFVRHHPAFNLVHGLLDIGWRWANLDIKYFQNAQEDGFLWWWKNKSGLLAFWLDDENEEMRPHVLVAVSPIDQLDEFLRDYRRLATRIDKKQVGWTAPVHPEVQAALQRAEFSRSWDISLYVFELRK